MSEREESPIKHENGSHLQHEENLKNLALLSPRKERSRSSSPRKRKSMSRSRSHSRSRRYTRHRRSRSRSRSRSPKYSNKKYVRERRSPYDYRFSRYGNSSGGGGSSGPGNGSYNLDARKPYRRSHSRSPMSSRRRHQGSRDNPPAGRCLGVFGLSIYTQERDLKEVFSRYGPLDDVQIVYDAQTGRSRGFSFVYFENTEDAALAKEKCNGIEIDGKKIRVDFSITQRAHTPTPGIYMGKPSYPKYRGGGGHSGGGNFDRGGGREYYDGRDDYPRDGSPQFYRDRRRFSRSRSVSPRYK